LVISGLSIVAVGDEPKKIQDRGVFGVTTLFSMWAYIWLLIVLKFWTPDYVTLTEAVLTLIFFFMLIITAFLADKYNEIKLKKEETKEEEVTRKKKQLRLAAKDEIQKMEGKENYSRAFLLEIVYGSQTGVTGNPEHDKIIKLFKLALEKTTLLGLELNELNQVFEPDTDIQQIRYKRAFGKMLGSKRDFVIMKGQVGQAEHEIENMNKLVMNPDVGFKSLHYSVTESSGKVRVEVLNFTSKPIQVGVKTL
jgi:hypothetical protein